MPEEKESEETQKEETQESKPNQDINPPDFKVDTFTEPKETINFNEK